MKVLLSSHGAGLYGAERMILALAEGLSGRGHHVVLEFPHRGPALDVARTLNGVEVLLSNRARLPRNLSEGARFLLDVPRAGKVLRDVVLAVEPEVTWVSSIFNPWAVVGARMAGSPVVWHFHERNPLPPLGLLAPALAGMTRAGVVAISSYVAGSLLPYPWLRGRVWRLDNPLLRPLPLLPFPPQGPFTVGYAGQLEPRKRAPDLARALAHLSGVQGVFVGDGKARGELEKVLAEEGLGGRVELLGFLDDAPGAYHRFHCLAVPSVREPFGLVALEAMASGLPVVAARSGALPEVLGDAALFHAPGDPLDLARQIERLRRDENLRRTLRERGMERVTHFSLEGWLDGVERILTATAMGKGPE